MSDVWDWTCKTWRGGSTSSLHRIETDSVRQTQCASQPPFRAQALKAQLISALLQLFVEKTTAGRRFDDGKRAFFWLKGEKPDPQAVHVGFVAKNHAEVDAFYKAAVNAGGKSKKAPQARPEYYPGYYATWVFDPDGHDTEVVHKSQVDY